MRPSISSRAAALVVLVGMTSAACVRPEQPGVAISSVEAKLVFGVEKPKDTAPTPSQAALGSFYGFVKRSFEVRGSDFEFPISDGVEPAACPEAVPTAVPVDVLTPYVGTAPEAGVFAWRGTATSINDSGEAVMTALPEHTRVVRRYEKVDDTTYRYQTVQPLFDEDRSFLVSTFQVRTESETVAPPQDAGPVQGVVTPPRVGEPDGGLSLVSTEVVDAAGQRVVGIQPFQPANPVLILPLPVPSGQQFQSAGVDPRTGQTLVNDGVVRFRERVDVCGELVDGWLVELDQTVAVAGETHNLQASYVVATHYGAVVIDELVRDADTNGAVHFTLADRVPTKLPKSLE